MGLHLLCKSSVVNRSHSYLEKFVLSRCLVPYRPVTNQVNQDDYFVKNQRLKRPISPFTVYKIQLTSLMSIVHRLTGIGLSVGIYGLGLSQLASTTNFPAQLATISSIVPSPIISLAKVLVVTSFGYHFANGIRHLIWDAGFGFGLKELYTSGYIVAAVTLLVLFYSIMEYR